MGLSEKEMDKMAPTTEFYTHSMIHLTQAICFYKEIGRGIHELLVEKVKPSGARILSCVTLLATSPPRSRAMAPIMAYNEVDRTDSMPEPCRLSVYGVLAV